MKRKYFLMIALTFVFVFTIAFNSATAKILLDDFSEDNLDLTKWKPQNWDENGNNTAVTDFIRETNQGSLVLKLGVESGNGRNSVSFTNPNTINVIEAEVAVVKTALVNDPDVGLQARIEGTFYNSQVAAGTTGDVWATIRLVEKGNGLEVGYVIEEALDENWNNSNVWKDTIATGLSYNQAYNLKIEYNSGLNEFTFTVEGVGSATVTSATLPSNVRATENPWRSLTTRIFNAVSGTNYIHALFDNVFVNDALYDDFKTSPLDLSRWNWGEYSRGIVDGTLHLNVQPIDERSTSSVQPENQETNYLEAKILIESGAQIAPGRSGLARLAGYFYNNSRDGSAGKPYDGEIGDAWVVNGIFLDDNNNLKAECYVWVSDKPDGWDSNAPRIFVETFTTPIAFDTSYTLSIEYTGSAFIFKLNDETVQYNIPDPQYPPSIGQYRTIQSRVYAEPGETGHIKVQVDDVYVEGDDTTGTTGGGGGGGGGCFISTMKE